MRDHAGKARSIRHLDGLQGFTERADLIEFNEYGVGYALVDASLQDACIGNEKIIAH